MLDFRYPQNDFLRNVERVRSSVVVKAGNPPKEEKGSCMCNELAYIVQRQSN
jgi:hypothetical protein